MSQVIKSVSILYIACTAVLALGGCATDAGDDSSQTAIEQDSKGHTEIHTEDNCDPVTFGALCNPNFHGTTTRAAFTAELTATMRVAAWEYGGGDIRVSAGDSFTVDNKGGETHTFWWSPTTAEAASPASTRRRATPWSLRSASPARTPPTSISPRRPASR